MAQKKEFDLDEVERLASLGLSEIQIGECLGVSRSTVQRNRAEGGAFEAAIKKGRSTGISTVANALHESAVGGNVTAAIFYLKCRAGWNESAEIEKRLEELETKLSGGQHGDNQADT
jgi:hypothetical protein